MGKRLVLRNFEAADEKCPLIDKTIVLKDN